MACITYEGATAPEVAPERSRKNWLVRLLEAFVESRMRKAEEEIERVRRIWPIS